MLLTFCWLRVPFLVPGRVSCVCRARVACWSWERVASWLVGAWSERQVIAVVCGSGIGDVLIELWFLLFVFWGTQVYDVPLMGLLTTESSSPCTLGFTFTHLSAFCKRPLMLWTSSSCQLARSWYHVIST